MFSRVRGKLGASVDKITYLPYMDDNMEEVVEEYMDGLEDEDMVALYNKLFNKNVTMS
jgi:hypothetical protein